jgi:hypothetical protein
MPLSLRIPSDKEEMIRKVAARAGKSKTSFIVEAVDEKLGLHKSRPIHHFDMGHTNQINPTTLCAGG